MKTLRAALSSVLVLLSSSLWLGAQLSMNVVVTPPYSVNVDDYIHLNNNTIITIFNTSNQTVQFKLIPELTGDNGVGAVVKTNFVPSTPIIIGPLQSKSFTGTQLNQYNANMTENDAIITGVNKQQVAQTGTLPEGNYTLCVKAFQYPNGPEVSNTPACTNIMLTNYDPPFFIVPSDGEEVTASVPQFVNFVWTPTGVPGVTRYALKIVDMDQNNLANINQAFQSPAVQTHFFQDNILGNTFPYDMSKPPLVPGHLYAIRVSAYDPSNTIAFNNQGHGPVSSFMYVAGQTPGIPGGGVQGPGDFQAPQDTVIVNANWGGPGLNVVNPPNMNPIVEDPQDGPGCENSCQVAAPSGPAVAIQTGQSFQAGKFVVKNVVTTGPNQGTGTVRIEFLKTDVTVQFSGIQVNAEGQMFSGTVTAKVDPGSVLSQAMADNENPDLAALYGQLNQLNAEVSNTAKRLSHFTGQQPPVNLPFSMDKSGLDMVVAGLIFTPTQSKLNVIVGYDVPESLTGQMLGLHGTGIGIRPNGFCSGQNLKLVLNQNMNVPLSNQANATVLRFLGGADKTSLTFDCQGPKKLTLAGEFEFHPDKLVALNAQGQEMPNQKVKIPFTYASEANLKDWILTGLGTVPPQFGLKGASGFVFSASDIVYDHHSSASAPNMVFHPDHPNHPSKGQANSHLWQGFYLGNLSMKFPEGFQKGNQTLSIALQKALIDGTGFWGDLTAQNVLKKSDNGSLGGWAFSIDALVFNVKASALAGASFSGGIELPVSSMALEYTVPISEMADNFELAVELGQDYALDMWIASMNLAGNSKVKIAKQGNQFVPSAELHGGLTVGWTKAYTDAQPEDKKPDVNQFQVPSLEFSNFKITSVNNKPKIESITVELDNINFDQANLLKLPISVSKVGILPEGDNFGLTLDIGVNFGGGDNGIGGKTSLTLMSALDLETKKFKYDKVNINSVEVDIETPMAKLKGGIELYQNHQEYGDGFRGWINATVIPIGAELGLVLQAGRTTQGQGFRYWMFDAAFSSTVAGIPMGPVTLYGLGGGGYYNMVREKLEIPIADMENLTANTFNKSPDGASNGVKFTPSEGGFGFSASAVIGLSGTSAIFNADLKFGMDFWPGGGVKEVYFDGKGFMMQNMVDRSSGGAMAGTAYIGVVPKSANDPNSPRFVCDVSITTNIGSIATLTAAANMYFSPNEWYVKFGYWDESIPPAQYDPFTDPKRVKLDVSVPIVGTVKFNAYFMVGNAIPSTLPPLSAGVAAKFGQPQPDAKYGMAKNGSGVSLGVGAQLDAYLQYAIIYADVFFEIGVDALILNMEGEECNGKSEFGINNWYADGRAYALLDVEGGLVLDLWFWKGKAPFIGFSTGALLKMKGPNPLWLSGNFFLDVEILGGLVKLKTNFYTEVGEKCGDGAGSPFDDIPIVSYTTPDDKEQKVHVYSDPQIAFNFHNEIFVLDGITDKGDPEIRAFSYKLLKTEYTHKVGNQTKIIPTDAPKYAQDGYACYVRPKEPLPELTAVNFRIETRGFEHKIDGYKVLAEYKQTFPVQVTEGVFHTDSMPDVILPQDIVFSWPAKRQQFFLKNEKPKGNLKMGNGICNHIFRTQSLDDPNEEYVYFVRWYELKNNNVYETPCTCSGQLVQFDIPAQMKNSSIYKWEIIRRGQPKGYQPEAEAKSKDNWRKIGGDGWQGEILQLSPNHLAIPDPEPNNQGLVLQIPPNNPNPNIPNFGPNFLQMNNQGGGGGGGMMVNNLNFVNNPPPPPPPQQGPGNLQNVPPKPGQKMISLEYYDRKLEGDLKSVKITEKVLHTDYFKTSKFNTVNQKAASMKAAGHTTKTYTLNRIKTVGLTNYDGPFNDVNVPFYLLKVEENFDFYDIDGVNYTDNWNEMITEFIPPIFSLKKTRSTPWFDQWYSNGADNKSLMWVPNQEKYRYWWPLWDPFEQEKPYATGTGLDAFYDHQWDIQLRDYIEDVDWQHRYIQIHNWKENRHNGGNKPIPFGFKKEFGETRVPSLEDVDVSLYGASYESTQDYLPMEFYAPQRHGIVNFNGKVVLQPMGLLTANQIQAETALNQNPNPGLNNLQFQNNQGGGGGFGMNMNYQANTTNHIAIADYTEYLGKRDFMTLTDKILYHYRDNLCGVIGAGDNPGLVIPGGVACVYDFYQDQKPTMMGIDAVLPYTFKYIPMRTFLLNHKNYHPRGADAIYFGLGNAEYEFSIPMLNGQDWPYFLPIIQW